MAYIQHGILCKALPGSIDTLKGGGRSDAFVPLDELVHLARDRADLGSTFDSMRNPLRTPRARILGFRFW